MDIKTLVQTTAKRLGMDLCGIASVDRFAESPAGKHPTEVLPGCKSVIVIGTRLLDGVIQANFRAYENGREDLKGLYGTYGYTMLPNFALTYACYGVAQAIERETGEVATPLSTGPMTNGAQISIRHAAVAAGLGEFGWLGIVLTPEFGPRNRFGVILTTAEIEPDPMYDGPKLCNPEVCRVCTTCCPGGALSRPGEKDKTCTLGDRTYTYGTVDVARCFSVEYAMRKEYGGAEDLVPHDVTYPEMAAALAKMPITERGLQHKDSWHCGKCLSYCPTGEWFKKFHDRGLSEGFRAGESRKDKD